MKQVLIVFQIVLSILLIIFVILQNKGSGLSEVFGGSDTFYSSKRGIEKVLFIGTVVISILFLVNSLAFLFV